MPLGEPLGSWHFTDRPCRRADPPSPVDHDESQPDAVAEDGIDPGPWERAAADYSRPFLHAEHAAGRFPRRVP